MADAPGKRSSRLLVASGISDLSKGVERIYSGWTGVSPMSQTYVIKVSASVQEQVHAKDKRVKKLTLTEITTPEEQKEILRERLKGRGFEQEGDDPDKLVRKKG